MRTSSALAASVAVCLWAGSAVAAEPPAWMAGCWAGQDGTAAAGAFEAWSTPRAGQMLGISQTVRNGKARFEYMRIEAGDAGVKFIPQPDA